MASAVKTVSFLEEDIEIIEALNNRVGQPGFSASVRQIIREWKAQQEGQMIITADKYSRLSEYQRKELVKLLG